MKQIKLAAAIAAVFLAGGAHAAVITIDDFSVAQGPISDLTANGIAVTDAIAIRTLSTNMLAVVAPASNTVEVVGGVLDITNGTGDDSEVKVTFNLGANLIPGGNNAFFRFNIIGSDANPTNIDFTLNGNAVGAFVLPGNASGILSFGANAADINAGGELVMTINGAAGWDLTLDALDLEFTPANPNPGIPEPGVVALLGLGLAGIKGLRRRK